MSEHCGYIVRIDTLRKHSNADRLQVATIFGNDTIVSLDVHPGDIGVYFPSDLQLSEEFCKVNDLVRRKDENGKECGGYLDPVKRNVRAINLRGEKSDGIYLPLSCLSSFGDVDTLAIGKTIDVWNGHEICCKYIPRSNPTAVAKTAHPVKAKRNIAPTFYEHADTEQLNYNLLAFRQGDEIELTLKMHGTSQRTGYLPLIREKKRTLIDKLLRRPAKTYTEYGYITGTRRTVLDPDRNTNTDGFYKDIDFRDAMAKKFEGKLHKGETVYYEIVGFQGPNGAPIMATCQNSKIKDKEFERTYGKETVFNYGCDPTGDYVPRPTENLSNQTIFVAPCCDVYVYRMTMVNEDGDVVEYTPDFARYRCEQMGVKHVMMFERFFIPVDCDVDPGNYVKEKAEQYFDGPDPIGRTHVREGVVARIVNRPVFTAYKTKNWSFKVLENIVKDMSDVPDMEEAQDLIEEETQE